MRTYTLVFVVLATVLLYTEHVNAAEICPKENCVTPEKCEIPVMNTQVLCQEQGTSCCSLVKMEYRTHCRHYGGECMDRCGTSLQRQAIDCPSNKVCCVLV
nr:PREDICTED: uncharacterized protein LOC105678050 [Linepithema humile]